MKSAPNTKHELASNLKRLPAEQIKKAVIKWLNTENSELSDWERTLLLEVDAFYERVNNQRGTKPVFFNDEAIN